ncbi:MAG: signal transduction histidine kinase [Cognaticolwellia sp.]|jgi:signal transduction histidine kinase
MGFRTRLHAWVDAPLEGLSQELRELARTQQLGALIMFSIMLVWVPILFVMDQVLLSIVVGTTLVIVVGAAGLLSRRGKPLVAGKIMMASLSIDLLYTIGAWGGVGESGAGWVVMIPMSALFYLPVRESAVWTLIAGLGVGGLWFMEGQGLIPESALDSDWTGFLDLFSLLMMVATITAALSVRSRAWVRVNQDLHDTNETLQKEIGVRQRAEEEARDAVAARTGFLATISHEIRTPLNGVLGITEVLLDTSLDEEQRELAETVKSSGKLLRTLLDDVLDYSKIDAGRVGLEHIALSLPGLLGRVSETWRTLAKEKGLELVVECPPGAPEWIFGDPVRLQQVLNNLVSNALKFTRSGHIALELLFAHGRMQIHVRDTGVGMSEQAQKCIFQPFRQADPSVARHYGGTGLGLAISRSLAQAMDGELRVVSTLGQGSVFTLDLPIQVAEVPSVTEKFTLEVLDLSGVRILVAEDNAVNQMVITRLLERLGVEVTVASNGQACLDAWESAASDLVLMDCQMPGMDGYQATERLREQGVRVPIIALTANNMPGDRVRSLQAGMNDHLGKPIHLDALNDCLRRWLGPRVS